MQGRCFGVKTLRQHIQRSKKETENYSKKKKKLVSISYDNAPRFDRSTTLTGMGPMFPKTKWITLQNLAHSGGV